MNPFDLKNKELITKYNLIAEKKFSQNFIIDKSLTDKIARQLKNIEKSNVIEIGSGPLTLTRSLIELPINKVTLIELDQKFSKLYQDIKPYYKQKIDYHFADILQFDIKKIGNNLNIISNLPYKISSPFLLKSCENYEVINQMVIMLQKEVAERIIAQPGSKNFGRLSVMMQSFFDVKKVMDLKAEAFFPKPKIASAIIYFKKNKKLPPIINISDLEHLTTILFTKRRKKIRTILKDYRINIPEIDFDKRPENLVLEEFYQLAYSLKKSAINIKNN